MTVSVVKLGNGITFATDIIQGIETVSISVLVKVGGRSENASNNGISHFLEHMAFKGTKSRSALQIAEEFDMIGGYFNAYTSKEKTVFYAKVLKDDIGVAVDILADIIQNSIFAEEEVEKERGVILQEIAQTIDTPDDIIFDYFHEQAYPDQPFGRTILGPSEYIAKVKRDDVVNFVNEHYCYENIIISCAGNFDKNKMLELVKGKFSTFQAIKPKLWQPAIYKGGDIRIQKDLEQVHLLIGYESLSYNHPDFYTQQVFSIILGGGMSSRLFQEIREKMGLVYSISSFGSSYSDTGMLTIYAGTSADSLAILIDTIGTEFKKICHSIGDEEINRAKAQVRAGLLMSQESSISRAEKLASNLATFGRHIPVSEIMEEINEVNASRLIAFAKKLFSQESLPTVASIGKIDSLYSYNDILNRISI